MTADIASNSADAVLRRAEALIENDPSAAAEAMRGLLADDPLNAQAYRLLARALAADATSIGTVTSSAADSLLMQAAQALQSSDLERAEIILRPRLRAKPAEVPALHMLAELAIRLDHPDEAEKLLSLALEHDPAAAPVKYSLASLLHRRNRSEEAVALLEDVLAAFPQHLAARNLLAAAFARAGQPDRAEDAYRDSLQRNPRQARTWAHYGNLLKTMGRSDDCLSALGQAIELDPEVGLGWWSLADLKTFRFDEGHIRRMQAALALPELGNEDRIEIEFAIGRAFEQAGAAAASFEHYERGNAARSAQVNYDPVRLTAYVDDAIHRFTSEFFDARGGHGVGSAEPIFIVGLTRSGSTLIEQIIGSHPQIEATFELHAMPEIANRISPELPSYAAALERCAVEEIGSFGEEYLSKTRGNRRTKKPYFVDKMPINWMHVPLIQLALPNAKIIDARRHPLDCCLSNYKQLYAGGLGHTYDLEHLGRYYSDYVRFMTHMDRMLHGRIHRVVHEELVADPDGEVRRLLDFLGLPFHENCLRFHESERAVRTASAEQVRRPINREGIGSWRKYEPWLEPLKRALGPVLDTYPKSPF